MLIPEQTISVLLGHVRFYNQLKFLLDLHDNDGEDHYYPAQATCYPYARLHVGLKC